jgi:hypothetical protein
MDSSLEPSISALEVWDLIRFRPPLESSRFEVSQVNVHSFFHRVQFEQELKVLFCLSFWEPRSASVINDI